MFLGVIGTWLYQQRATMDRMARMTREMQRQARESANAPGVAELRAFGCNRADITDMRRIYDIVGIADAGPGGDLGITCNIRLGMDEPSCEQVASVYVKAVGEAAQPFTARVRREETNQVLCTEAYARDGSRL
ncbi:hypothetical protein HPC49_13215 [Pyxidicoccus fallax]|uniref:hypothetical protein n=1 Tax=Pyxidicoccus fallax TaxID=394095 RepID=UPI001493FA90|nr:hypothetical protein [Pyxidicoccus fallax]NPC79193.1 hypothetical protein [Pyxidicoccus fallax]